MKEFELMSLEAEEFCCCSQDGMAFRTFETVYDSTFIRTLKPYHFLIITPITLLSLSVWRVELQRFTA